MKSDSEMTNDDFTEIRDALADRVMEYFSLYESLASDEGLHPATITAVHLGALSTFNNMAIMAREGDFLPQFLHFMYKMSVYMEENPPVNPYKDILDLPENPDV